MIRSLLYQVFAFILGLMASFALILGVEIVSNVVHPFPSDFKGTPEEI